MTTSVQLGVSPPANPFLNQVPLAPASLNVEESYPKLLSSYTLAHWPAATCALSYKVLCPRKLLKKGFKCSGERSLEFVSSRQRIMLAPEVVKGGMVVGGPDDTQALQRFSMRLKSCTDVANSPYGIEGGIKFSIQKELDLNQEIVLDDQFAIKTKKLIILRGEELVHLIKKSYEDVHSLINLIVIDMDVRVSIEKTLQIPETKDNLELLSYCGWMVVKDDQSQYHLKCPCCQRCVPFSILKMLNTASQHAQKRTFNPLSFHFNYCFYSPFYNIFTKKMGALDILRETVVLKKTWNEVAAEKGNLAGGHASSLRLLHLKFLKHERILHDQIIAKCLKSQSKPVEQQKQPTDSEQIEDHKIVGGKQVGQRQKEILDSISTMVNRRKRNSSEMADGQIEDVHEEDIEPSKIRQKISEISQINHEELTKINEKIQNMQSFVRNAFQVKKLIKVATGEAGEPKSPSVQQIIQIIEQEAKQFDDDIHNGDSDNYQFSHSDDEPEQPVVQEAEMEQTGQVYEHQSPAPKSPTKIEKLIQDEQAEIDKLPEDEKKEQEEAEGDETNNGDKSARNLEEHKEVDDKKQVLEGSSLVVNEQQSSIVEPDMSNVAIADQAKAIQSLFSNQEQALQSADPADPDENANPIEAVEQPIASMEEEKTDEKKE